MKKGLNGWVEVFSAGRHTDSAGRTKEFTTGDLDRIAHGYDPATHEAPAVVGHPRDNAPAFGWVEGVKREGEKLLAKFKQVVPEFEEMVKSGLFKKRSISLYPDGTLRHVGWLGAQPPAVKGLKDVGFAADDQCSQYEFSEEDPTMGELEDVKKKLEEEKTAREKAENDARSYKEAAERATTDFAEAEKKRRRKEIVDFVEGGIKEGKILPAWKEKGIVEFMDGLDQAGGEFEFSEGKKQSPLTWFKGFMSEFSAHPLFKEFTKPEGENSDHGEAGEIPADLTQHV